MIIYTRMGWLVAVIWLSAIALASQVSPDLITTYGMGVSRAAGIFLLAAVMSAPLLFIVGSFLNRHKTPRTIVRYGKERTVNWGTHTFYMLPIEFWAMMIPAVTLVLYAIFALIGT